MSFYIAGRVVRKEIKFDRYPSIWLSKKLAMPADRRRFSCERVSGAGFWYFLKTYKAFIILLQLYRIHSAASDSVNVEVSFSCWWRYSAKAQRLSGRNSAAQGHGALLLLLLLTRTACATNDNLLESVVRRNLRPRDVIILDLQTQRMFSVHNKHQ